MGDYVKLIVHAEVRADEEELNKEIEKLKLCDSAYHCSGVVKSVVKSEYGDVIHLTLIGQTKYARNQSEFIEWLKPKVIDGSGPSEVFAMQFDEMYSEPQCHSKRKMMGKNDHY